MAGRGAAPDPSRAPVDHGLVILAPITPTRMSGPTSSPAASRFDALRPADLPASAAGGPASFAVDDDPGGGQPEPFGDADGCPVLGMHVHGQEVHAVVRQPGGHPGGG